MDLLFVDDDSGKGTEESKIVKRLQEEYSVRIHVRRKEKGAG